MTKSSQLQLRVSPKEKAYLRSEAKRAGVSVSAWVLGQVIPSGRERFERCIASLHQGTAESYAFAELSDYLHALPKAEFVQALGQPPALPDSERLQNTIAAMVEVAAHQKGTAVPPWTQSIAPMKHPWFGSELKSLRLHLLINAPPPFRRRNLFVDSSVGARV